eukprot:scaffold82322_cov66-Phaeocystis_antarctica.AAC.10
MAPRAVDDRRFHRRRRATRAPKFRACNTPTTIRPGSLPHPTLHVPILDHGTYTWESLVSYGSSLFTWVSLLRTYVGTNMLSGAEGTRARQARSLSAGGSRQSALCPVLRQEAPLDTPPSQIHGKTQGTVAFCLSRWRACSNIVFYVFLGNQCNVSAAISAWLTASHPNS